MANKRMFALEMINSDAFLDMPQSTQLLYFHLGMRADDDGFINNVKTITRSVGCKEDDIKLLIAKKFILTFESGIIAIKHWNINNYIASDRYHETKYLEEKKQLSVDEKGAYTFKKGIPAIEYRQRKKEKREAISNSENQCIQPVYNTDTEIRQDKTRQELDKYSKDKISKDKIKEDKNLSIYSTKDSDNMLHRENERKIDREKEKHYSSLFKNYIKLVDDWNNLSIETKTTIFNALNSFKQVINNGYDCDKEGLDLYHELDKKVQVVLGI